MTLRQLVKWAKDARMPLDAELTVDFWIDGDDGRVRAEGLAVKEAKGRSAEVMGGGDPVFVLLARGTYKDCRLVVTRTQQDPDRAMVIRDVDPFGGA